MSKKKSSPAKKSVLKRILTVFCSLVVLLAILCGVILAFPGTFAKIAITNTVSHLLGVKITVGDINFKPFQGRLELRNLTIYNPEGRGYTSECAIHLGFVNAEVVPFSAIFGKKTIIRELVLKDIAVHYETDLLLNSNLQDIIKNLDKLRSEEKKDAPAESSNTSSERGIEVDLFELNNVGLYIVAKGVNAKAGIPLTINPMGPFGKDKPDGISPIEFSLHVLGTILVDASKQAGISISNAAMNAVDALQMQKTLNDTTKQAKSTAKTLDDASKNVVNESKKLVDSVKKLF